jgi:phage pi2 protein 07
VGAGTGEQKVEIMKIEYSCMKFSNIKKAQLDPWVMMDLSQNKSTQSIFYVMYHV